MPDWELWPVFAVYASGLVGFLNLAYGLAADVFAAWMALVSIAGAGIATVVAAFRSIGNKARTAWYREEEGDAFDWRGAQLPNGVWIGWWTHHEGGDDDA